MPRVFISYSEQDEALGQWLYRSCQNFGIDTFLAPISLQPGGKWKDEILSNLKKAKWFFFLATPDSIASDAVKYEIGGALVLNKNIIPILHDVKFKDLPEWVADYQGIEVQNDNVEHLRETLNSIAKRIEADKVITALLVGAFVVAVAFFLLQED